jgi:hypothetical protein
MVDLQIAKARGLTAERLQAIFTPNCKPDPALKIEQADIDRVWGTSGLVNRIRSRVQEGQTRNLTSWRYWYALDLAFDTSFRQINPTLLNSLLKEGDNTDGDKGDLMKKIGAFGLSDEVFVRDEKDKTGKSTGKKIVNAPAFFNLLFPLVKSYITRFQAKIVNDMDLFPLLKFEPAYTTTDNKFKCEVLTNRVQVIATQYSFFEVLQQTVLKMLHYGTALLFIKEEWHSESQVKTRKATDADVSAGVRNSTTGETAKVGDDIEAEVVEKEGLRYHLPHPSRTYRDLSHGQYTYNTDIGCMFGGYWEIARYRELIGKGYWNTGAIKMGVKNIVEDYWPFFQSVYSACTMKYPVGEAAGAAAAGVGVTSTDSERQLSNQFYGTDQYDQGVFVTNHFEKLIPSENGLGNYTDPIWMRFVLAGDGCTVLYAAPLPSCPILYAGYDPDESREKNGSLGGDTLPFQDHLGMMLSQIILSCKQNLANLTMANTDLLEDGEIDKLSNYGEKIYRSINVIGKSFKKLAKSIGMRKYENDDVFQSWSLPKANVAEMINVLKTILDVCDRLVQMSSIDLAQQASHEQTETEVNALQASSSTRVTFIAKSFHILADAQKRQIYNYLMSYGDEDFYTHIPNFPMLTDDQLKKLGFTAVENEVVFPTDRYRRVKVAKTSMVLPLYEFASTRSDVNRRSDPKTAVAMSQILMPLVQNPLTAQALGARQILDYATRIAHLAGVDRDFVLRPVTGTPEDQKKQAEEQLQALLAIVDKKIIADFEPLFKEVKQIQTEVAALYRVANIAPPPQNQPGGAPPPTEQPGPPNAAPPPGGAPGQ